MIHHVLERAHLAHALLRSIHNKSRSVPVVHAAPETPQALPNPSDELYVHENRLWILLFGCMFVFFSLFLLALRFGCRSKIFEREYEEMPKEEEGSCDAHNKIINIRTAIVDHHPPLKHAPRPSAPAVPQNEILKSEIREIAVRLSTSELRGMELEEAVSSLTAQQQEMEAVLSTMQAELDQLRRARRWNERGGVAAPPAFAARSDAVRASLRASAAAGAAGAGPPGGLGWPADDDGSSAESGYSGTYAFVRPASQRR